MDIFTCNLLSNLSENQHNYAEFLIHVTKHATKSERKSPFFSVSICVCLFLGVRCGVTVPLRSRERRTSLTFLSMFLPRSDGEVMEPEE